MITERRRHPRVEINSEFLDVDTGTTPHAQNLSLRGVFLRTDADLPLGAELQVRFSVVVDDFVVISARGRVVHRSVSPRGVGVEFLELRPEMRAELNRVIRLKDVRDRWESGEHVSSEEWDFAQTTPVPTPLFDPKVLSSPKIGKIGSHLRPAASRSRVSPIDRTASGPTSTASTALSRPKSGASSATISSSSAGAPIAKPGASSRPAVEASTSFRAAEKGSLPDPSRLPRPGRAVQSNAADDDDDDDDAITHVFYYPPADPNRQG